MFSTLMQSLKEIWNGMSTMRRIVLAGLVLVPFFALFLFAAVKPEQYLPLFTNLQPSDAGQVIAVLKEQKVPYKVSDGGSAILVPKESVYETRVELASMGLPQGGVVGFELFDSNPLGLTDFDQRVRYTRALQGELTRTIMSLREVENARVHVVLPEKSLFIREDRPATASVVLQLRPGAVLTASQVQGIVNLVASSVAGLARKDVTVLDTNGNILSQPSYESMEGNLDNGSVMQRLDIQRRFEKEQEQKIASMLEQVLGIGRVVVRVSARLNFDYLEERSSLVTPQGEGTLKSEQTSNERYTGRQPGGSPGVDANIPGYEIDAGGSSSYEKETVTRDYELGKKETYRIVAPGFVEQLSVAVWLNTEPDASLSDRVRNAVSSAVGIDPTRGDSITIENTKFGTGLEAAPAAEQLPVVAKTDSPGLNWLPLMAGIPALLLLAVFLLRRRPAAPQRGTLVDLQVGEAVGQTAAASAEEDELEANLPPEQLERRQLVTSISRLAKENPEEVAKLIKMWMLED